MSKRQMWVMFCLMWAGIWFVLGVFFFPFWLFTLVSVLMIVAPIGVSERPMPYNGPIRHNPDEWKKR